MSRVAGIAIGVLSAVPAGIIIWLLFYVENLNREETPARTAACHRLQGTARLNRHGTYTGCLVPPGGR